MTKKVSYKPEIKTLVRQRAAATAREVRKVQDLDRSRKIRKLVVRGTTYDKIAHRMSMDVKDVMNEVKAICERWLTDEALDAESLRAIELQHLRAMKEYAMYMAMPHPLTDDVGNPVMVRNCDCAEPDDPNINKPCYIESHNIQAKTPGSKEWMQMAMQISARIAAMGGLDAADKLKERVVDQMERSYKGIPQQAIDNL